MDDAHALADHRMLLVDEPMAGVCRLTLNRPERLNALTEAMLVELRQALHNCQADETVRCVILKGAGCSFCAGQDLNDRDPRKLPEMPDLEEVQKTLFHPVVQTMQNMDKPVIVAVHGIAAGAGSSLAFAGDIVVAARSAKFIQSFCKVGLSVDAGGGWQLVKSLGPARARGVLMMGEEISAEEAEQTGLIWRCVDDDALINETLALAARLSNGPTVALGAIKAAVAAASSAETFDSYLVREAKLQGRAGRSNDYREGVLAFLEKRPAKFEGR